jgi:hypothetical protein
VTEPTPLPTDYTCPEGTFPGWLNADGLPTSCVSDLPLVEPLPEPAPTRTVDPNQPELIPPIGICLTECGPAAPDQLADTGSIDALLPIVVLAGVFIAAGGAIMRRAGRAERSAS